MFSTAAIGGFSKISHLALVNCRSLARQIGSLFTGRLPWKQLKHLNLYRSIFSRRDLEALFNIIVAGSTGSFPKLTSLAISANDETPLYLLLQASSVTLTQLFLDTTNVETHEVTHGKMLLRHVKSCRIRLDFPAITLFKSLTLHGILDVNDLNTITKNLNHDSIMRLDFNRNTAIRENLSKLLSHTFPSLHSLGLSDCGLTSEDLSSLRRANISSKLPKLKHLDISQNSRSDLLTDFCFGECEWNNLISLNIQGTGKGQEQAKYLDTLVKSNCLTSLCKLTVSSYGAQRVTVKWPNLHTLQGLDISLSDIADAVDGGFFPKLRRICISCGYSRTSSFPPDIETRLNNAKINAHFTVSSQFPFTTSCVCQEDWDDSCF